MKIYNKLVRDRIPEIIKKDGMIPNYWILTDKDYKTELLKKLVEESHEALATDGNREELTKELGDLLEVIDSTIKAFDLNNEDILALKEKRRQERGGFESRTYLESVD